MSSTITRPHHRKVLFLAAALLCALLFASTVQARAQTDPSLAEENAGPQAISVKTIDCPMTLPEGEVEGETIICGQIEVPEDWDNPDGPTISITYAVAKAVSEAPFPDPIVYFEGGPGASALEFIENLSKDFTQLRQQRDIIYFDQRGTRYGSELDCPFEIVSPGVLNPPEATDAPSADELDAILAAMPDPPTLDDDPAEIVAQAREAGPSTTTKNCAPHLQEEGVDLSAFSTANSARDTIALLDALGYPEYNLYGISYGTTVVLEMLRYYQENQDLALPSVRSAVIDGVYPTYIDFFTHPLLVPDVVLDVFASCEADEACAEAYPDIRQRAIDLLAELEETPITLDDETQITKDDVVNVLRNAVQNANHSAVTYLPRLIDELERGETEVYNRLREGTLPAETAEVDLGPQNLFDPITSKADDLAEQTRQVADQIKSMAAQSQRVSEALAQGLSMPEFYAETLSRSMEEEPFASQAYTYAFAEATVFGEPTVDNIQKLSGLAQEEDIPLLLGIIANMDETDIEKAFELLRQPEYLGRLQGVSPVTNIVIECNDRYGTFDLAAAFEKFREYDAPQLLTALDQDLKYLVDCEEYGLTEDPRPFPDPVTSGIRTLVSNGALDIATRVIWGETAYDSLTNAEMITFPMSPHGATVKSQCAKDITNFFFTYPDAELNLSCVEEMKPVFVLPDDELPEAPAVVGDEFE